jgi:hypothetical protein
MHDAIFRTLVHAVNSLDRDTDDTRETDELVGMVKILTACYGYHIAQGCLTEAIESVINHWDEEDKTAFAGYVRQRITERLER